MMTHANLPISFLGDALLTVVYILNRVSSKSVSATTYELWHGRKPFLAHLCPWGSTGYVHNPTHKNKKLGPRATKMVFVQYPEHSKGYVMYGEHPNGGMTEVDSRNVDFLGDEFPCIGEIKKDLALYELPLDDQLSLGEGENIETHHVIEDSTPLIGREDVLLVTQENQHVVEVRSSSLNHEHSPNHEHDVVSEHENRSVDSPPIEDSPSLSNKGRHSSVSQTNIGTQLRKSECGRIPR